jgi:hypothetical protein
MLNTLNDSILQEIKMKSRFYAAFIFYLLLLSSCDLLPSESTPAQLEGVPTTTNIAQAPKESQTQGPTVTVLLPDTQTSTSTPQPTNTPTESSTSTPMPPTLTPTITPTKQLFQKPTATPHFLGVQIGSPVGIPNFAHPDLGCQWLGVAGQVFDSDGTPIKDLVVEFGGSLAGQDMTGLAITGSASTYGPGGYEFKLADEPIASSASLWVRVFDLEGSQLSARTNFNTYGTCDKNLILLNFVQSYNLPNSWVYIPVIYR